MTPDRVILMGLRTAIDAAPAGMPGISRHTWVLKVLFEQLVFLLPRDSPSGRAIARVNDSCRGVTDAVVARATDHLLGSDFLIADGSGHTAVWQIKPGRIAEVDRMIGGLSPTENLAMRTAAQRTLAMSLAWSKTFRA
jgi:hypothetical protein